MSYQLKILGYELAYDNFLQANPVSSIWHLAY